MKWPFVSRARYDALRVEHKKWQLAWGEKGRDYHLERENWKALIEHERDAYKSLLARYSDLLEKYHALRVSGANPEPPKVEVPAPEMPPPAVLAAMRAISPRNDATFRSNWSLWENNKEEAKKDPAAFAERIRRGRLNPDVEVPLPN